MSDQNGSESSGNPPSGGAPDGQQNTPSIAWLPNADEDTVGYVQNKKWADPGAMLTSYKNLETLVGAPADQIIRIPRDDTPEAWNQVFDRLGRPKVADDYDVPMPEQGAADPEYIKGFKTMAHQVGLTPKQVKALAEWNNGYAKTALTAQDEAGQSKYQADESELKKAWGAALEQNTQVAKLAAGKFGVPPEQVDALQKVMGYKATMEFFHKIGAGLGEDTFVGNGQGGGSSGFSGALTPGQARAAMNDLQSDKAWMSSYLSGDKVKLDRMDQLQRMANGG